MTLGLILGILGFFGMVILTVGSNMIHGFPLTPQIASLISMGLGIIVAGHAVIYDLLVGPIAGVVAKSKLTGDPLAIILRNDKKLRFATAKMESGMAHSKEFGPFLIMPDSVYNLPTGNTGFIAYYKYGVNLNPKFIRAITRTRELGLENIEEIESVNKTMKDQGKELNINLDAPEVRENG